MSDLHSLKRIYELKEVYRYNSVGNRNESSAEHTWSALILADYFFDKVKQKMNRAKVFELLLYHDLVEIEAGDVPLHHTKKRLNKHVLEKKAMVKLCKQFPAPINARFKKFFLEFEDQKTIESRFARSIDRLDSIFNEMNYKNGWWVTVGEKKVREVNAGAYDEFPVLKDFFEEIILYVRKNKFFGR